MLGNRYRVIGFLLLLVAVVGGAHSAYSQGQGQAVSGKRKVISGRTAQLRSAGSVSHLLVPADMSEGFEGSWPAAGWVLADQSDNDGGEYLLGKRDCHPRTGSYGGWSVGGGAAGSLLDCAGTYPNYADTWAIYGPFDLTNATTATLTYHVWGQVEYADQCPYDFFHVGASTDGQYFEGDFWCGDWTGGDAGNGYYELTFDLSGWLGQSQVWLGLGLYTDQADTFSGITFDDLTLAVEPSPPPPVGRVFLPIAFRGFPVIPAAPVLNAISNPDGDGNYTVGWSSSAGADTYTLEEDDTPGFSSPTTVYSGPSTSTDISGRGLGVYYYRVRASNAYGDSDWSNVESVEVTVLPPPCPQTGAWSGTTSQGYEISFVVENSPQCQIAAESLSITTYDSCGQERSTVYINSFPITNNQFSAGGQVVGEFTSSTTVSGTFDISYGNPSPPPPFCSASGTWTAAP